MELTSITQNKTLQLFLKVYLLGGYVQCCKLMEEVVELANFTNN